MGDKSNPTGSQPGPHIMSNETAQRQGTRFRRDRELGLIDCAFSLEEPLSRDELRKRAEVSSTLHA